MFLFPSAHSESEQKYTWLVLSINRLIDPTMTYQLTQMLEEQSSIAKNTKSLIDIVPMH